MQPVKVRTARIQTSSLVTPPLMSPFRRMRQWQVGEYVLGGREREGGREGASECMCFGLGEGVYRADKITSLSQAVGYGYMMTVCMRAQKI